MTKKEVVTLIGVIAKVRQVADDQHNGMVYDNILTIFNGLKTAEKRVLLKGLINICFVVEDKILVSIDDLVEVKDAVEHTKSRVDDVYTVEQTNKQLLASQLIHLKTLITKAIILTLITILMGFMIFLVYANPSGEFVAILDKLLSFF